VRQWLRSHLTYANTMVTMFAFVLFGGGALATATARADVRATPGELLALSESAVFDPATGQVTFTLTFNRPPDFQTTDSVGRQADSFQYYIVGDPSLPYPSNYDTIVRGEELHLTSDVLRVRNATPSDPTDPASGGWGTVRGVVPYQLNGNVLTFSTSLGLISDHSVDGHFSYDLLIAQYGGLTQFFSGLESAVRPRPAAKGECKHGGWKRFGFKNQGQCIAFVNHHR
jgi:hypothetical protein